MATEPIRAQEKIRFGDDLELDLRLYELRRAGRLLKLERIPMQVLLLLIERNDEIVTREQIVSRIWGKDVFLDTDNSINGAIRKIRQVLKDHPDRPQFVQTVTGRGYRFIAPFSSELQSKAPGGIAKAPEGLTLAPRPVEVLERGLSPQEPDRVAKRLNSRNVLLVLVIVAAVITGLWLTRSLSKRRVIGAAMPLRSIAVLPLDNFSGDRSQDYFVDGMTDQLITDLAKVSSLRVTSRTSVMRYKGTKKALPEIARELNVDGVVEGSVTRSGQRVRITAQLIHAPTDTHIWAETYDRDLGDVLKLQSEVADAIAQQVRAQLTPEDKARLGSARAVKPEAYEAYLKGRYYLLNDFTTAQPLNMAKSYFEEAVRKDPSFALAYVGLADSYMYLGFFRDLSSETAFRSANEVSTKALELDKTMGEVHDTMGQLSWRFAWDLKAAEREFSQAIALAPSYSCAHEDRAVFLSFLGRREEAMAEIAKSKEMDPSSGSAMAETAAYYQLRDFPALVEASRRGIVSQPNEWTQQYNLGVGYQGTGKLLEAITQYQKAVEMSGDQDATASLAYAYALIGRRAEAKKILVDLQRKSKTAYVSPYLIATIYAGLGDKDQAFKFLRQAFEQRSLELSWHIKADLRLDSLRSDARFQDLLRGFRSN